ncbi:MAG TPA: mechanosensitive ion channel family protein [Candidatus Eisenbacteria bacterium]|nr:mechanosensitive ion channel family protein [Candidatus Eisenbacteria bacterium]
MNPVLPTQEQAFSIATLAIRLGLVALATIVSVRITYLLIGRIEAAIRDEAKGAEVARDKRAKTIGSVLRSVSRGLIILIGLLMGAHELGLDITPALAAAGGFGVAAGLGAQSLIKDWISGFFFIHDNQFAVGDVIRVAGVSGTVEMLSLRHTELRDSEGFIHFIPNGDIKVVTNLTKSWSTPLVRIPVSLVEDPDRVIAVIEAMLVDFRQDLRVKPHLLEGPRVLGIEDVSTGQFTLLLQAKTIPEQRLFVARALRLAILERLRAEGISLHTAAGTEGVPHAPSVSAPEDEGR